jgi:hypothetical protein
MRSALTVKALTPPWSAESLEEEGAEVHPVVEVLSAPEATALSAIEPLGANEVSRVAKVGHPVVPEPPVWTTVMRAIARPTMSGPEDRGWHTPAEQIDPDGQVDAHRVPQEVSAAPHVTGQDTAHLPLQEGSVHGTTSVGAEVTVVGQLPPVMNAADWTHRP